MTYPTPPRYPEPTTCPNCGRKAAEVICSLCKVPRLSDAAVFLVALIVGLPVLLMGWPK